MGDSCIAFPIITKDNWKAELLAPCRTDNLLSDFACSAAYSMLVAPASGIAQLADNAAGTHLLPKVQIINEPVDAQFGSTRWHVQQLGSAAGMVIPFLILHKGVSRLSNEVCNRIEASSLTFPGNANLASGHSYRAIVDSALAGACYEGLLCPSRDGTIDLASSRLKQAASGALTFGTLSSAGAGWRSLADFAHLGSASYLTAGILAGIPAGVVSAESQSLLNGKGHASTSELLKSAYGFAFVGGALSIAGVLNARPTDTHLSDRYVSNFEHQHYHEDARNVARSKETSGADWLRSVSDDYIPSRQQKYWRRMVNRFEKRCQREDISYGQMAEVYANLSRILEGSEARQAKGVNPQLCTQVAREILENVAFPNHIDQGSHQTCVLNSVENIIASNHPGRYADLVANLALDGSYFRGNTGIELPKRCLIPDAEARELPRKSGNRCFASQLVQYFLANLHWNGGGELPDLRQTDPGEVKYMPIADGANKAALYVNGRMYKEAVESKRGITSLQPYDAPHIFDNEIVPLFRKIVPRGAIQVIDHKDGIERSRDRAGRRTVSTFSTVAELRRILLRIKPNSTICGVRSEGLGGDDGWHAVVLRNYDRSTDTVYLDNSWGYADDFSGKKGQKGRLPVDKLFNLMKPPDS